MAPAMRIVVTVSLLVVAVIHLLPAYGVLGDRALRALYGTAPLGGEVQLLMRHRAAMFGILGVFFLVAAFQPALHTAALVVGAGSVISFLALAVGAGVTSAHITRVVVADIVALAFLMVAAAAHVYQRAG